MASVLIVDDDEISTMLATSVLERAELSDHTDTAPDGAVAIEMLRTGSVRPDLILLDINMPRMSGFEFLETYAELDADIRRRIVVVMTTTSLLAVDRERAEADPHVLGFISKPLTLDHAAELKHLLESTTG